MGEEISFTKEKGGVFVDWWWYLDTCINLFVHGDSLSIAGRTVLAPRGPGVLQCWMLSVAGGIWVSQRSAVVAVLSF
jgi:hypothetical protein